MLERILQSPVARTCRAFQTSGDSYVPKMTARPPSAPYSLRGRKGIYPPPCSAVARAPDLQQVVSAYHAPESPD